MSVNGSATSQAASGGWIGVLSSPKAQQFILQGLGWILGAVVVVSTFESHVQTARVLLIAGAIGLGGWALWQDWIPWNRLRPVLPPLAVVLAAILVSAAFSIDPAYSFSAFFEQHLWFAALFLVTGAWAVTPERQMVILRGFLITAGLGATGGIVLYFLGAEDFVKVSYTPEGTVMLRAEGMLESYTRSGMVFILALPATVAVGLESLRRRRVGWMIAALVVCGLSIWFLILTRSRGPWLAAALSTVLVLVLMRGRWWMLVGLAALAAGLLFASPQGRARAATLGADLSQPDLLLSGRLGLWEQGLDRIAVRPLVGLGYGGDIFTTDIGIEKYELLTDSREPDLHQIYLQTLAEVGVIGFAAYAWLVVTLLVMGARGLRGQAGPGPLVAYSVLVAFLVYGVVACYNENHVALLLWLMSGMLVLPRSTESPHSLASSS